MINPVSVINNNIFFSGLFQKSDNKKKPVSCAKSDNLITPASIYSKNEIDIKRSDAEAYDFFKQKGKVTQDEYEYIKSSKPEIIEQARRLTQDSLSKNKMHTSPKEAAELILATDLLKDENTKIISIGTSPSFITEAISAKGGDVTFIPISNAALCISQNSLKDYFEYYPNFELVGDYLKYKGITPKNLKDKNVLLLDYASTGRTLLLMGRLVNEYCGIPEDKIRKQNISDLITDAHNKHERNTPEESSSIDPEKINDDIFNQRVEIASNVPHFSIFADFRNRRKSYSIAAGLKNKQTLFKEFDEFSKPQARAYQLCVLQELDKLNKKFFK